MLRVCRKNLRRGLWGKHGKFALTWESYSNHRPEGEAGGGKKKGWWGRQDIFSSPTQKKHEEIPKLKDLKNGDVNVKRNWLDSEAETLIVFKGGMQPKFIKNAKKQGMSLKSFICLYINFIISGKRLGYKDVDMLKEA